MRYIGVDLHKTQFSVYWMEEDGSNKFECYPMNGEGLSGDISDIENKKKLAAYAGLVPRMHESNGKYKNGRITKRGDKIFRTTLVQVALIAIKYNRYLRSFYERLKAKKGSGKAIIATTRKMLDIIYDTLKNDWEFKDFNNFVLV